MQLLLGVELLHRCASCSRIGKVDVPVLGGDEVLDQFDHCE